MEIERKFMVKDVQENLENFRCLDILQGYIFFEPVVRLRKQNDEYILCIKSSGLLAREEFELPLSKDEFNRMWKKVEGTPIEKKRYLIPLESGHICELDVFSGELSRLIIAEVEFDSLENAKSFISPKWFGDELTFLSEYTNKNLSRWGMPDKNRQNSVDI